MTSIIHWILQTNLIKPDVLQRIRMSLDLDGIGYDEVKIIPFADALPPVRYPDRFNVFYGSTTLIMNVARDKRLSAGVFYDPRTFNIANYLRHWGDRMLNHDSQITTFPAFATRLHDEDSEWFLRPNEDNKAFSGTVMRFSDIQKLAAELGISNNPHLGPDTQIVVSSPKSIAREWRHFIVNGKVISSSRYARNGEPDVAGWDVPEDLLRFVEESCEVYTPHDIFVMDTALCNGRYAIIECNCFNGTGFYDHDITQVVRAINEHLKQKRP